MPDYKNIPLNIKPGVQRDGTQLDSDQYVDALWTRWDNNRPRKMGGYKRLTNTLAGIPRELHAFPNDGRTYVHVGEPQGIDVVTINSDGTVGSVTDRTPVGFTSSAYNDWQLDATYDAGGSITTLVAHAAPNLSSISNSTEEPYYIGDILATTPLTVVSGSDVAGGVVCLQPFTFRYGHDGFIGWSDINNPGNISTGSAGDARVSATKIVRGLPLRGSSTGPAGLFWALDSLIRASFVGDAAVWQFDTLSADVSVLSSNAICEYDGIYYWAGVERFQMFNGVVREIPNDDNLNWFFTNLNYSQRQKVFTMKVPRFGEIWWCFPFGNATECTHACILNVRTGLWYDTELPADLRSAALYAQVYPYPIMGSPLGDDVTNGYALWQHETGTDLVYGSTQLAVKANHQTPWLTIGNLGDPTSEMGISISSIEPDLIQTGAMTVRLLARANAKATPIVSDPVTIEETPVEGLNQLAKFKTSARQIAFVFESNTAGGNYWMGKCMVHIQPADGKLTQ